MKNTTKHLALIFGIFACALLYSEHCAAEEKVLYTPRDYSIVQGGNPFVLDGDDSTVPDAGLPSDRHHIGNRWVGFGGLGWYDNTARMHDPLLLRFTTPDPLARDFLSLSVIYCTFEEHLHIYQYLT